MVVAVWSEDTFGCTNGKGFIYGAATFGCASEVLGAYTGPLCAFAFAPFLEAKAGLLVGYGFAVSGGEDEVAYLAF